MRALGVLGAALLLKQSSAGPLSNVSRALEPSDHYTLSSNETVPDSHVQSVTGHYTYTILSLFYLTVMGFLLGKRSEQLRIVRLQDIQPIRVLVISVYLFAIVMVIGLSIMLQAQGLSSTGGCAAGIIVCLVGYLGTKVLLYLFLIERLHALKYRQSRLRDKTWLVSVTIVLTGFGTIVGTAFTYSVSYFSRETGKCYIGLSEGTLIALLGYDMFVNVTLTALFINFLLSPLRFRYQHTPEAEQTGGLTYRLTLLTSTSAKQSPDQSQTPTPDAPVARGVVDVKSTQNIENLLRKSLIGLLLIMLPTVANLAALLHFQGREPGWLCFTLCLADVMFQVVIMHWMTRTPLDLANKIRLCPRRRSPMGLRNAIDETSALPPAYDAKDSSATAHQESA